jgi:DNA-directed RNA polymerase subunit N (RpoN/RPB10)
MSTVPPVYYKWSQFDEYCSCGTRTAVIQREFEEREKELLARGIPLKEARIQILKHFGIKKMCCLRDLTFFPKNFICDTCVNSSIDITINKGKVFKENVRHGNRSVEVGWEFQPKTKGVLGFNLDSYCSKLTRISQSPFDKLAILRKDGSSSFKTPAQFPGYKIVRSEDFPCLQPEIPVISLEELSFSNLVY